MRCVVAFAIIAASNILSVAASTASDISITSDSVVSGWTGHDQECSQAINPAKVPQATEPNCYNFAANSTNAKINSPYPWAYATIFGQENCQSIANLSIQYLKQVDPYTCVKVGNGHIAGPGKYYQGEENSLGEPGSILLSNGTVPKAVSDGFDADPPSSCSVVSAAVGSTQTPYCQCNTGDKEQALYAANTVVSKFSILKLLFLDQI